MIYFFSGTPGSGKSLDMARCILNDLKFNKPVITNFDIYPPKKLQNRTLIIKDNLSLTPEFLIDFSNQYFKNHRFREGAINLYIDECQLLFNARTWNIKGRDSWNKFFTNHRHFGYDVVLSAQFDRMIDRQIRSLFETEVIHRKVNNLGLKGLYFRILFASPTLFMKIHYYYPIHEKTRVEFFRYNKRIASVYNSYDKSFVATSTGEEIEATGREVSISSPDEVKTKEIIQFQAENRLKKTNCSLDYQATKGSV